MNITYNGKEYQLNVKQAFKDGLLTPVGITDLEAGDVVQSKSGVKSVVIECVAGYTGKGDSYCLAGTDYNYSRICLNNINFLSKKDMIACLNKDGYIFLDNISDPLCHAVNELKA